MIRFSRETQRNYLRDVDRFATFLGRSPHTATVEDVHQFQIAQNAAGMPTPIINAIVSVLRFFFTQTLDRPDLARKLVQVAQPRNLPIVLSRDEVARLLNATVCLKHQAALPVAYGAGLRVAEVAVLKISDIDNERMLLRVERGRLSLTILTHKAASSGPLHPASRTTQGTGAVFTSFFCFTSSSSVTGRSVPP